MKKLLTRTEPYQYSPYEPAEEKHFYSAKMVIGSIVLAGLMLIGGCLFSNPAHAQDIDMLKIAQIESNGCKHKIGDSNESWGCYQINDALKDWNNDHPNEHYTLKQMLNDALCFKVANWYFNTKIPAYLKHYRIADTMRNRIIAYNAGIGNLVKRKTLTQTTIKYLKKYGA